MHWTRRHFFSLMVLPLAPVPLRAQKPGIRGAGSTFAAPAYTSWGFAYAKESNISVVYQATGSGDGIRQIKSRSVDFGATDYPLPAEELSKNGLIQFPTLVGGIVPVFNLPGVRPGQLKLNGPVLAGIYMGRIERWSDRAIQALNPGLVLPNLPIRRIARADESGSTATFTTYLARTDADWASRIGSGLAIAWPNGVDTAKGTGGVAKMVLELPGAIGYVSANQVNQARLAYPLLQNRSKQFVPPTEDAFRAAVKSRVAASENETVDFVDTPGAGAWPITDATFILLEKKPRNPEAAAQTLRFFYWAFLRGDAMASESGYVPLPATIQARAVGSFRLIQDAQDNPLNFMTQNSKVLLAAR